MSGFQGLTLPLQERHGELVEDVGMLLVGHVAAVLDDKQLSCKPESRPSPTPRGTTRSSRPHTSRVGTLTSARRGVLSGNWQGPASRLATNASTVIQPRGDAIAARAEEDVGELVLAA